MWISNTATTAMMIPIVDAIAQVSVEGQDPDDLDDDPANKEEGAPLASQDPSNADTGEIFWPLLWAKSPKNKFFAKIFLRQFFWGSFLTSFIKTSGLPKTACIKNLHSNPVSE